MGKKISKKDVFFLTKNYVFGQGGVEVEVCNMMEIIPDPKKAWNADFQMEVVVNGEDKLIDFFESDLRPLAKFFDEEDWEKWPKQFKFKLTTEDITNKNGEPCKKWRIIPPEEVVK
jgi:hypothetical protein